MWKSQKGFGPWRKGAENGRRLSFSRYGTSLSSLVTRNSEKVSFSRRGRLGAASRPAAKRNFFIKFIEERLRLCFYAPLRTCSAVKVSETWCPKPGSVLCPQVLNHELATSACPHRFVSHFRPHFHFHRLTCHIQRNVSVSLFHENHYITSMEIDLFDQC